MAGQEPGRLLSHCRLATPGTARQSWAAEPDGERTSGFAASMSASRPVRALRIVDDHLKSGHSSRNSPPALSGADRMAHKSNVYDLACKGFRGSSGDMARCSHMFGPSAYRPPCRPGRAAPIERIQVLRCVQLLADSDFTVGIDAVDLEPVFGEIKTDPAWRAAPLIVASHTTTFWHI